jgi:hypothetical protein
MYKLIILSFLSCIIFVNCKKKTTTQSYTPSCTTTQSYSINVKPLIQNSCVSCHGGYGNYTGAKSSGLSIRASIVNGSMPKGSTFSEDQKNTIVCWIDAGCPNN